MKRLVALLPVLIAFQAGAPPALAWTWPADGPVLRPFVFGEDPYAGGQHRGVDVAGPAGAHVLSPAAGAVSFAGTVPGGGRSVTVQTADGYSVTLLHLGSYEVARGAFVAEGAAVGTIGPSGAAEHAEPYVHLGIRVTSEPHGYVDPLTLLPERRAQPPLPPPAQAPAPAPAEPSPPVKPPEVPEAPAPEAEAPAADPGASEPGRSEPIRPSLVVPRTIRRQAPAPATTSRPLPPPMERDVRARLGIAPTFSSRALPTPGDLPREIPAGADVRPGLLPAVASDRRSRVQDGAVVAGGAVVFLALGLGGLLLALCRRQLAEAGTADALAPVADNRPRRAAEDAGTPGPAEQDRLVLHGDLERVALGEPEPLPDLDRDDDPAQLIQVPDDPCRRLRPAVSPGRFHRVGRHAPSRCRSVDGLDVVTPCVVPHPLVPAFARLKTAGRQAESRPYDGRG
jgi:Peptidase family M23